MVLRTSSHSCQKLLDFVLRGTHRCAASLIDDVITYSTTVEDHLIHIRTVLERFRKAGLTLKAKKCRVAANRTNLFGFEICRGVVTRDDEKIQAVKNWAVPKTRKQLQSFVGFCGYIRHHISRFCPRPCLCKGNYLKWNVEHQTAFETLKSALITKPVLRAADPRKEFEIFAAAADKNSISGVLKQRENSQDNSGYAVSFCSRKLTDEERHYPTI